ncbi:FepA family TonB-dependent siderophore receptor [Stenotrophomonas sp. MMGLT7]|uniref:FepA family TonB-dependent siderophore receptor n=1 Tax=Stenotrophomonas sp. MMGLT7 TaxID=2901227 RepID=UPI001E2EBC1E|nr:FepA family TonB-dependent siderophore receptor [Stenotrophomonas sp. MMGLT7]MCD7099200.1 FepA family TonB-dependent siderophore receptor [Stenotrophomonas sp. MMGLT7]
MSAHPHFPSRSIRRPLAAALAAAMLALSLPAAAQDAEKDKADEARHRDDHPRGGRHGDGDDATTFDTIHVTAEQIARQALGTSIITREDIESRPPANDLSELLRTMPGVNLTGNSASGQYGNNRQIDLRGMGPENTLILVDGKRVGSRDSVRMGRSGERNTRGDTNWVPAEAIERIEVLRGPAAARYGSGASGGVVNIVTRKPTGDLEGSLSLYGLVPEHSDEGGSQRVGFTLSGPLARDWSFRMYGNLNKTDADSLELNSAYAADNGDMSPAGREGVRNKDINGLLRWDPSENQVVEFEAGFSRQGNIYAGERGLASTYNADLMGTLAEGGAETNIMIRRTAAITHRGKWGFGTSRVSLSYEETDNTRLDEGMAGRTEGALTSTWSTSLLKNWMLDGELNIPSVLGGVDNIWTVGFEARDNKLDDPYSVSSSATTFVDGVDYGDGSDVNEQKSAALFVEDNIYLGERWILTPGLRLDHYDQFGNNFSPSLNAQYKLGGDWLLKGGVARAFKAPNLYQSNPNYLYQSNGGGCYYAYGGSCYILGNADLDPETSINKEIGVEWAPDTGWHASLTYFHNDYQNKITVSTTPVGAVGTRYVYLWENASKAIVQGMEGNLGVPLLGERGDVLKWNTNVTWMIENKNKQTDQPLSVIPDYTVNTSLDWHATEALSLALTGTFYGRQHSATQDSTGAAVEGDELGAYHVLGISGRYRITSKVSLGLGVNNLADKRLYRTAVRNSSGSVNASSYNEPGRAYWATLNIGF